MILTITQSGIDAENTAITSTGKMPIFDKIILGDGQPNPSPYQANALTHLAYTTEVLVVERLSDGAIKLTTHVPIEVEVDIKEIGLTLSDGTLYAYCPYCPETNGFYKAQGFEFSFYVILSREDIPNLVFTYEPVNTDEIKNIIVAQATNEINVQLSEAINLKVDKDSDTGAVLLPMGTSAQRSTAGQGKLRFNTDLAKFEGHNGSDWVSLNDTTDIVINDAATSTTQAWSSAKINAVITGLQTQVNTINNSLTAVNALIYAGL